MLAHIPQIVVSTAVMLAISLEFAIVLGLRLGAFSRAGHLVTPREEVP